MMILPSVRVLVCLALLGTIWALTACTPSTSDLSWLKDDHSTVCVTVIGPWGTVRAVRVNQNAGTVLPVCAVTQ